MKKHLLFTSVAAACLAIAAGSGMAQTRPKPAVPPEDRSEKMVRASPAYSEVVLRRAEWDSELEMLMLDYTDDYPKIKSLRYSLGQLKKYGDVLLAVKNGDSLTVALGKLIVRKVELETELWVLQQSYADAHPDIKRARRRVEIYDRAIKEILG